MNGRHTNPKGYPLSFQQIIRRHKWIKPAAVVLGAFYVVNKFSSPGSVTKTNTDRILTGVSSALRATPGVRQTLNNTDRR